MQEQATHHPAVERDTQGKTQAFDSGLVITHEVTESWAIVHVDGPLTFPDAVALSHVIKDLVERSPDLLFLDLIEVGKIDATGVGVLVGAGGDLKDSGKQVRVIVADPRVRHRLPYSLGLRKVFTSLQEAMAFDAD